MKLLSAVLIMFFAVKTPVAQTIPVSPRGYACNIVLSSQEQSDLLSWSLTKHLGRPPICIIYNPSAMTTCLFKTIKTYLISKGSGVTCQIQRDSEIHNVSDLGWSIQGGQLIIAEL